MKVIGTLLCLLSFWLGAWLIDITVGPYKVASVGTAVILFLIGVHFIEKGSNRSKNRTTSLGPY